MHSERREYRLTFTNVERSVNITRALVLSRHPSETPEHLTLRVLAWMLLWSEALAFGPSLTDGEAPDLIAQDLTGAVSTWVACGDITPRLARKVVQHNRYAEVHVVFAGQDLRDRFVAAAATERGDPPRGWNRLQLWTIDAPLITALAQREHHRQSWTVTVVGDHIYAQVDGQSYDGAVTRG
jgi:uncharacterized protein YaeQ